MKRLRHVDASASGSNPAYVTSRVRSRRAALLDEADYRKLVRMGPNAIARFLEETVYEREINRLGARHSGVDLVEYALNENLSRTFDDLLDWANGVLYEQLATYLRKFDAWNIKTVLRGLYTDTDPDDVEVDLIRGGEMSDAEVDALLEATTIEEVIDRLSGTMFHDRLEEALPEYDDTGLLFPLENAVDRAFYENVVEGIAVQLYGGAARTMHGPRLGASSPTGLYREFLTAEIDFLNVRNALRIARNEARIEPAVYFVEGGRLFRRGELARLVQNVDELVNTIREGPYRDELADALAHLDEEDSLLPVEQAIELAMVAYGDRLGSRYPVSVTPVIAFVLAKELEVRNVRAIARGREAGLSEEEIRDELVIP